MNCTDVDKVLPVVLMARGMGRLQEVVQARFGVDTTDGGKFYKWLGENARFHGTNGANIHVVWEALIWEIYGNGKEWDI